ncbi:TPA: ABC transporter permease, partial [Burkholderia multivorans]|nr:ABC transporter permease [Burkholderia multivorans]HEM7908289.1 ABC transporter permease [Burkholderia multivorans]HEM8539414.1 ABC transporter permease [Burkholderia multivorans]
YLAAAILFVIVAGTVLVPMLEHTSANAIDLGAALLPPSLTHWLGTDQLGRDVLARILAGGRISLFVVFVSVLAGGGSGCLLGVLAGYRRGWIDTLIMRAADLQYSLPPVIVALVAALTLGTGITNLALAIALATWPRFARIVRAEALHLRERDFVLLAELANVSTARILIRHLLPNMVTTLIVLATLDIGLVITLEATLSFLGLGIQPPDPSWGTMIADGRAYLSQAWWLSIAPGSALVLTILCANATADQFRHRASSSAVTSNV